MKIRNLFYFLLLTLVSCYSNIYKMTPQTKTIYDNIDKRHDLTKTVLLKNTPYATTAFYFDSQMPGKTALILGGTHGNEPAGYEAALRLIEQLINRPPRRGKVIIVPFANRQADEKFKRRIKVTKDAHFERGNLNRCYPGNAHGLPMEQMAYQIQKIAIENDIDLFIDMHEALFLHLNPPKESFRKRGLGQTIIYHPNEASSWIMMNILDDVNTIVENPNHRFSPIEKPIMNSAAWWVGINLRIASFTFETSRSLPLKDRIKYQLKMVESSLIQTGIWK